MMSRLLLNLRQESRSVHGSRATATQTMTDTHLVFTTRIVGNLTADFRNSFGSAPSTRTGLSHSGLGTGSGTGSTASMYGEFGGQRHDRNAGGEDDLDDLYVIDHDDEPVQDRAPGAGLGLEMEMTTLDRRRRYSDPGSA